MWHFTTGFSFTISQVNHRRLIVCFLFCYDTYHLILWQTKAGYCQFFWHVLAAIFSLFSYFGAEGGLKRNFHRVYCVQKGDIFHTGSLQQDVYVLKFRLFGFYCWLYIYKQNWEPSSQIEFGLAGSFYWFWDIYKVE